VFLSEPSGGSSGASHPTYADEGASMANALIRQNQNLQSANTFGLPCTVRALACPSSLKALAALCHSPWRDKYPLFFLGAGSNVLLPETLDALVIRPEMKGRFVLQETPSHWRLEARAGENWHEWVIWTLNQGFHGLENLALIPGTVGAAPVQNIGAYGLEVAEYLESVGVFDIQTATFFRLEKAECAFRYRDSLFKRQPHWLIVDVRFALPKQGALRLDYPDLAHWARQQVRSPNANDVAQAVIRIRQAKLPDPAKEGNAGSFFRNPIVDLAFFHRLQARFGPFPHYPQTDGHVKLAAGWLIDQCGWKGKGLGPVACHERQALVLVNRGGACLADVLAFSRRIQSDVLERFGVVLEPEPVCLGAV
jgi:UDP-N-acetylmuramate dehydrogenase